jgi:peroxiredoxin
LPSAIEEVHRDFKDQGLVVIAINLGENRAVVAAWATDKKLSMPVLLDRELAAYRAYQIAFTPTVFLVGRDGKLVGKAVGNKSWTSDQGRALLRALLGP